jgi:hypothetical protein
MLIDQDCRLMVSSISGQLNSIPVSMVYSDFMSGIDLKIAGYDEREGLKLMTIENMVPASISPTTDLHKVNFKVEWGGGRKKIDHIICDDQTMFYDIEGKIRMGDMVSYMGLTKNFRHHLYQDTMSVITGIDLVKASGAYYHIDAGFNPIYINGLLIHDDNLPF